MANEISKILKVQHEGDEKQLEVIFSSEDRILVEAPAGYGKTTTMVSRLAYLIATEKIQYPKKILVLTFSVNAALKVKRDVHAMLPGLLGKQKNSDYVGTKLVITNYHGFCKKVLRKYGYLISEDLKDLDNLKSLADYEVMRLSNLNANEKSIVNSLKEMVEKGQKIDKELIKKYNTIIIQKLIVNQKITYNAIILLVIQLFKENPNLKKFYQIYFSLLVVDEYQDTNVIAWYLIHQLINDKTKLLLMGDPLQRIYGFIGAYQNIMSISAKKYEMTSISLNRNYRLRNNKEMLKLDENIRKNAICFTDPQINEIAHLPYFYGNKQSDEGIWISQKIKRLLHSNENAKIAILVKNSGPNTEVIANCLQAADIDCFYSLFTDENADFLDFNRFCLEKLKEVITDQSNATRVELDKFLKETKSYYKKSSSKVIESLIYLLEIFIAKIIEEYKHITVEERMNLIKEVFENKQLKQMMEHVSSDVVLSTIHGAKGLEWDYVILADIEKGIIPNYRACRICQNQNCNSTNNQECRIVRLNKEMEKILLEELSVFYVAVTRARKQIYITSSSENHTPNGINTNNILSCLPLLSGISLSNPNLITDEQLEILKEEADSYLHLYALAKSNPITEIDIACCECNEEYICINDDFAPIGTCLNCGIHNFIIYCGLCKMASGTTDTILDENILNHCESCEARICNH